MVFLYWLCWGTKITFYLFIYAQPLSNNVDQTERQRESQTEISTYRIGPDGVLAD